MAPTVAADEPADDAALYTAEEFGTDAVLDALPDELREIIPQDADLFDPNSLLEMGTADGLLSLLQSVLRQVLRPALGTLSTLLGLILVSSALGALRGTLKSDSLTAVFDFTSALCILLAMYTTISGLFEAVQTYLTQLSALMGTMLPVMTAVSIAGGNLSASAVSANGMMLALNFVQTLAAHGLFPMLQLCFGLTAASGIGGGLKLDGITKLVRDGMAWILALIAAVISAMMGFQNSIASRADSLSMRAVKFTASRVIPVVGGIASDAVTTVAGSLSLVRSTVGMAGVALILLLTLPVILHVLLTRLGVTLTQTAASVIGLDREKNLLGEMGSLLGFLAAVCVISALMFIYALTLFAKCSAAIGG